MLSVSKARRAFLFDLNISAYVRTLYLSEACPRRIFAYSLANKPNSNGAYVRRHAYCSYYGDYRRCTGLRLQVGSE